jgi:hypothetical protein
MWFGLVALVVSVVAFAWQAWLFQADRAEGMIRDWAQSERLVVVRYERRLLETGPYQVVTAADLPVYQVVVRNSGRERTGWVRCGRFPWGILDPHLEVSWDEDALKRS